AYSCVEHSSEGCAGRSWPLIFLPRHGWLAFIARHALSAVLLSGKSGTTTNDGSIGRFEYSSNHVDFDRWQNCQYDFIPDPWFDRWWDFRENTERSGDLHRHWRSARNYGS